MQYKTTIEVVTEADSKYEAADLAGEFLKGNLSSGADIRVKTISSAKSKALRAIAVIFVTSAVLSTPFIYGKVSYRTAKVENKPVTSYALKTNLTDIQNSAEFKKLWEKEQKDRINSIAR
jgi:hypothetical protein